MTLDEAKSKAWQAVERSLLYDEHADGCSEDEDSRLYAEADDALDELWAIGRDSAVCEKCKIEVRIANAKAQGVQACLGENMIKAREALMSEVASVTSRPVEQFPRIVELVGDLMMAVRTGNK